MTDQKTGLLPGLKAKANAAPRDLLDRYYTPAWAVEAICERLDTEGRPLAGLRVLEPCAGDGAIAAVLRRRGAEVVTGDFDPEVSVDHRWDFPAVVRELGADGFERAYGRFDLLVTNPPYSTPTTSAADVVRAARQVAETVICLLRIAWLDVADEREDLLADDFPGSIVSLPRVGYRKPGEEEMGGSQYPSGWMGWGRQLPRSGAVKKSERDRWIRVCSPQLELL